MIVKNRTAGGTSEAPVPFISPDATEKVLVGDPATERDQTKFPKVDVVFPVLHGLLRGGRHGPGALGAGAESPMWAAASLASAVSMDKLYTKTDCDEPGDPPGRIRAGDAGKSWSDMDAGGWTGSRTQFPYPVFMKPSNAGSSKGVARRGQPGGTGSTDFMEAATP